MKKALLAALLVIVFSVGCGNGNPTVPQPNDLSDLSGLVGEWHISYEKFGAEDHWTITPTTITSSDAESFTWQYDGVTLTIGATYVDEWNDNSGDCGWMIKTEHWTALIPLLPYQADTNFTGSCHYIRTSENCPKKDLHYVVRDCGSMEKECEY